MNRLSFRMTQDAHKAARTIVVESLERVAAIRLQIGYTEESKTALRNSIEQVKKHNAHNEQVKTDLGIEFEFKYLGLLPSENDENWVGDTWEVLGKGDFKITFRQGVGNRACFYSSRGSSDTIALVVPPSAMDILYCIMLDNPRDESFENWCADLGYDEDSRRAERIYRACIDQAMMFRRNYPGVDLDKYEPLEDF